MPANTSLGFPYPVGTDRLMDGDNVIESLARKINDSTGVATSGFLTIPVPAVDTNYSAAVTFPVGLFTANPIMVATHITGSPNVVFTSCTNVTASSGTVYHRRSSGTGTGQIYWLALQV